MYFESLHDLFFMNGHGAYVWSAYGIGFAVLAALVWLPLSRQAQLKASILKESTLRQLTGEQ
ncbi:MAG TPA: heme exporter protein CcmD [Pseudomonadales bacterium]|nr:heme exporter protein CcmD [Pseudomonadales bacterium]